MKRCTTTWETRTCSGAGHARRRERAPARARPAHVRLRARAAAAAAASGHRGGDRVRSPADVDGAAGVGEQADAGNDRRPGAQPVHVVEQVDRVSNTDYPKHGHPDIDQLVTGERQCKSESDDDRCTNELAEKLLIWLDIEHVVYQTDDE